MENVTQHYQQQFTAFQGNGAAAAPAWVNDLRKKGMQLFGANGFPTTKLEDWKYTNVAAIAKAPFSYKAPFTAVSSETVRSRAIVGTEQFTAVFVNGHFTPEHSSLQGLPSGMTVETFADAVKNHPDLVQQHLGSYVKQEKNPFTSLNTAFMNAGMVVHVEKSVAVEKPLHLLFLSTTTAEGPTATHLRNLIVAEEEASVNILLSYVSVGTHTNLTNAVTEVVAKDRSRVELVKVQRESESAYHVENLHVHQWTHSTVHVFSLAIGAAIARNDMSVIIDGPATECNLNGLYITSGEQLIDHHTFMHHIHPDCPSHELFKGILMDKSRAVFNGKVYVEPEAQKTDSKQTNRNLLLSDDAVVDTKPELEIFADDVKCTHGAAVGGMNDVHSFYLKTRGISHDSARGILTVGFAAEVTQKIVHEALRRHVDLAVVEHLRAKFGTSNLPDIVHG